MSKKYWSKMVPNCTCEVVGDPDSNGLSVGWITDPSFNPDPFASVLNLEDGWSSVEVVPVPDEVPDAGYLVIFGDPVEPSFSFHTSETGAIRTSVTLGAFGYVPIAIPRYTMIPMGVD